jgi:hypothetical protein
MVQNIRVAQEAYKSETQQYANISANLTDWYPQGSAGPVAGIQTSWLGGSCQCNAPYTWSMLPLHVDGPVLFGYATVAGVAGATPPTPSFKGATLTMPASTAITTDWYVIAAAGDLDSDPNTGTLVVGASWTNQLSVVNEGQ